MANVIPPKTPDPVDNDPFGADHSAKPWQFSLRHLLAIMSGACLLGAAYHWIGPGIVLLLGVLLVVGVVAAAITNKRAVELLVVVAIVGVLIAWLTPATNPPGPSRRSTCSNNLKQIVIALHNYHDVYSSLPPAYVADKRGRPLHSWRVLILPFMEQKWLYDQYDFNEPWDGPNNSKLAGKIGSYFQCPSDAGNGPHATETNYVAVIGNSTAWPGEKTVNLSDIKDGTSGTILIVEAHNSGIHWMEPRDLHIQQMPVAINSPRGQGIASAHPRGANVAFAEGSVRFIAEDTPPETVRAMLTIAGGEPIPLP